MINIKPVKKHKGNVEYFVGDDGNVYRKLKPWLTTSGYLSLKLQGKHYDVHRLVAEHFIDNPENKSTVNHKDFDRENNEIDNLEWLTQKENVNHYLENGGTAVKNFVKSDLYKGDELIAECDSVEQASRVAEALGCSYAMINKHRKHKDYRIVKR